MNPHLINDLIHRTVRSDEELNELRWADIGAVLAAIGRLESAGLTPAQLQWFLGERFSRFGERECLETLVLALAVERQTISVEALHTRLRNDEIWSRMHHRSRLFATDPLPDCAAIDQSLGLQEGIHPALTPDPHASMPSNCRALAHRTSQSPRDTAL